MAEPITLVVESAVIDGKLDDLRSLIAEVTAHCSATEPGMLRYDWFVSDDGTEVRVLEQYADSEAVRFHAANYASFMPALAECRTPMRMTLLGDADDELRAVLAQRGALMFTSLSAFSR